MPDFVHKPVMLAEVLSALQPKPGGRYVDATVGGAGHAAAILAASSPTGWLYGCDRDGAAIETAKARLSPFAGRFELRRGNFAELRKARSFFDNRFSSMPKLRLVMAALICCQVSRGTLVRRRT